MDPKMNVWKEGDWIYLAEDGVKCQAVLKTITNVVSMYEAQFLD
jgi:hypothetical protein